MRHFTVERLDAHKTRYISNVSFLQATRHLSEEEDGSCWKKEFFRHLCDSPFQAYYFETPGMCGEKASKSRFEFVLIDAPQLLDRPADPLTFQSYYGNTDRRAVAFVNLSGDAMLVVPVLHRSTECRHYSHLADFMRHADMLTQHEVWSQAAKTLVTDCFYQDPQKMFWLSSSGDGVAWLHLRIDTSPKYFKHTDYQR